MYLSNSGRTPEPKSRTHPPQKKQQKKKHDPKHRSLGCHGKNKKNKCVRPESAPSPLRRPSASKRSPRRTERPASARKVGRDGRVRRCAAGGSLVGCLCSFSTSSVDLSYTSPFSVVGQSLIGTILLPQLQWTLTGQLSVICDHLYSCSFSMLICTSLRLF